MVNQTVSLIIIRAALETDDSSKGMEDITVQDFNDFKIMLIHY